MNPRDDTAAMDGCSFCLVSNYWVDGPDVHLCYRDVTHLFEVQGSIDSVSGVPFGPVYFLLPKSACEVPELDRAIGVVNLSVTTQHTRNSLQPAVSLFQSKPFVDAFGLRARDWCSYCDNVASYVVKRFTGRVLTRRSYCPSTMSLEMRLHG